MRATPTSYIITNLQQSPPTPPRATRLAPINAHQRPRAGPCAAATRGCPYAVGSTVHSPPSITAYGPLAPPPLATAMRSGFRAFARPVFCPLETATKTSTGTGKLLTSACAPPTTLGPSRQSTYPFAGEQRRLREMIKHTQTPIALPLLCPKDGNASVKSESALSSFLH